MCIHRPVLNSYFPNDLTFKLKQILKLCTCVFLKRWFNCLFEFHTLRASCYVLIVFKSAKYYSGCGLVLEWVLFPTDMNQCWTVGFSNCGAKPGAFSNRGCLLCSGWVSHSSILMLFLLSPPAKWLHRDVTMHAIHFVDPKSNSALLYIKSHNYFKRIYCFPASTPTKSML